MSLRSHSLCFVVAVTACMGCSKSDPDASTSKAQTPAAPPSDPAALAAHEFVSAVVKGDTDRATKLLTPQAIQQFETSGQRFAAPGLDSAQFRIGQVRKVSEVQSLVQCMLTDKTAPAGTPEQEMCCLMRLVEGQWRVSGIAVDMENGQPMILNFEQPEQPQTQPPANQQQFATQPGAVPPAVAQPAATQPGMIPLGPLPPTEIRTAQEPVAPPQ